MFNIHGILIWGSQKHRKIKSIPCAIPPSKKKISPSIFLVPPLLMLFRKPYYVFTKLMSMSWSSNKDPERNWTKPRRSRWNFIKWVICTRRYLNEFFHCSETALPLTKNCRNCDCSLSKMYYFTYWYDSYTFRAFVSTASTLLCVLCNKEPSLL